MLIGLGARMFGREASLKLGIAAGACAFAAILGGQLFVAQAHVAGAGASSDESGYGINWLTPLWLLMAVLSAFKLAASRPQR